MIMQPDSELAKVIDTLAPPRRLTRRLDRWQQQRNQNPNDRDYNQQLDERETVAIPAAAETDCKPKFGH